MSALIKRTTPSRPILRALTVLITREDEKALTVLARGTEMTRDQFISQMIRKTYAAMWAKANEDPAAVPGAVVQFEGEPGPCIQDGTGEPPAAPIRNAEMAIEIDMVQLR